MADTTSMRPRIHPAPGSFVALRHRHWLVEAITLPPVPGASAVVELSCIDDDAPGADLTVLWEAEPDARLLGDDPWAGVGQADFDPAERFGAYLRTLRWNCVTATDPAVLQAPFRAGIRVEPYQLEPLRKALLLPRVNLFIADDVGLGKTIEAGLIVRELLLRRRADAVVVAAPPGMLVQWREEMEARFGLSFTVLDRERIAAIRRDRGWSTNPWTTGSFFLVSHRLLAEEAYAADLRAWLGNFRPKAMLILDEAHHAAPASGARYAIDSKFTRAIRELAERFEHRLFLSATPHNGHSNSFSALLEILDPQRFVRGVRVRKGDLDAVMVRRLKEDIREVQGGFPRRIVEQVDIADLPANAPELVLADLLARLREMRERRLAGANSSTRNAGLLVLTTLQQRLLSSIEAFARTIRVHADALTRQVGTEGASITARERDLLSSAPGSDDDDDSRDEQAAAALARATALAGSLPAELELVREMVNIADGARDSEDARVRWLTGWIQTHMQAGGVWNERRLIVFTEWEDTRRWLERRLKAVLGEDQRIASYTGSTSPDERERLKRAFNSPPARDPLRVLIATDAAREGLNLQRHCRDLLHFDLPWNPSRLEQRNGRIDRKLQPASEVTCRYFFFPQRPEDRVLRTLVRKSENIRRDLGSMAAVLETRAAALTAQGIRRDGIAELVRGIESIEPGADAATAAEELEAARERQDALLAQLDRLRRQFERSGRGMALSPDRLRATLSAALALGGASPLALEGDAALDRPDTWRLPATLARDPSWAPTLDALREPRPLGEPVSAWRARSVLRPVAFEDTGLLGDDAVHLHLEHRVVRRLLARFATQGLLHLDLSRACLATGRPGEARVVLLGRLALFGPGAVRLHEEIVPVAARWVEPAARRGPLRPYGEEGQATTLDMLEAALSAAPRSVPAQVQERLRASIAADIADLRRHLEPAAAEARARAERQLADRAEREGNEMARLLAEQRRRLTRAAADAETPAQLELNFPNEAERRQRQADQRAWQRRLELLSREEAEEPQRVRDGYAVRAARLDAVGIAYLWPASG